MSEGARSALPKEAWERALIESARVRSAGAAHISAVLCRSRGCRSTIVVQRQEVPPRVHWSCPSCRRSGSLVCAPVTGEGREDYAGVPERQRLCARFEPLAFQHLLAPELATTGGARALAAARPANGAIEVEGAFEELRALRRTLTRALMRALERGVRLELEGLLGALALARPAHPIAESLPELPPLDEATSLALALPPERRVYELELEHLYAEPKHLRRLEVPGNTDFAALGRAIQERLGWSGGRRSLFSCGEHLIAPRGVELPCELEVAEELRFGDLAPPPGGALRFTWGFRAPRLVAVYVKSVRAQTGP